MSSALAAGYRYPDVEAHLTEALKVAGFTGVRVWTVDVLTGYPHWVAVHQVQIDTRASSKAAAHDRAWNVAGTVLDAATWDDGILAAADVVSGPSWLPDENGAPRYVARYEFTVHPLKDSIN